MSRQPPAFPRAEGVAHSPASHRALCSSAQPVQGQIFLPGKKRERETRSSRPSAKHLRQRWLFQAPSLQGTAAGKSAAESVSAPEAPPALSRRQAALLRNARTRQPCLQPWQAPQGHNTEAVSLQSSMHNITYVHPTRPQKSTNPTLSRNLPTVRSRASSKTMLDHKLFSCPRGDQPWCATCSPQRLLHPSSASPGRPP